MNEFFVFISWIVMILVCWALLLCLVLVVFSGNKLDEQDDWEEGDV